MPEPHLVHAVVENSTKTLVNPGDATAQALKTVLVTSAGTAVSPSNQLPVYTNNSEVVLSASFARPADTTAYAAGDLVANNTTAGSVVPLSFTNAIRSAGDCVRIERVRVEKTSTSLTNAFFRVHLFESTPSVTVGDNGVFNSSSTLATGSILSHAGSAPVQMVWAGSDGAIGFGTPTTGSGMTIRPSSGTTVFALVEVTAAYTPVSGETFTIILEGYRT